MIVIHVHNIKILPDRSERNLWAYRPATALPPGPPQNPHLFLGKTNEKGDPCLLSDFASFFSNFVGLPIFQNFRHDFLLPNFLQI